MSKAIGLLLSIGLGWFTFHHTPAPTAAIATVHANTHSAGQNLFIYVVSKLI